MKKLIREWQDYDKNIEKFGGSGIITKRLYEVSPSEFGCKDMDDFLSICDVDSLKEMLKTAITEQHYELSSKIKKRLEKIEEENT